VREPLKVHFDGKFVGEVPDTGDQQANLKAMTALLRSHAGAAPLTRPQAAFRQASAFAINAQHLFNTGLVGVPPRNPMNVIPFAVNAAFAIELYFKTLGFVYGRNMHGHDLLKLFEKLPAEAKELLRQEIARAPATEGIKDIDGFRTEIGRVRHVFEEWRYLHERNNASEIRFVEFIRVIDVLHNVCRTHEQIRPATPITATGAVRPVGAAT
jgi:hypothetical protein